VISGNDGEVIARKPPQILDEHMVANLDGCALANCLTVLELGAPFESDTGLAHRCLIRKTVSSCQRRSRKRSNCVAGWRLSHSPGQIAC
jgi:hypothetical protein